MIHCFIIFYDCFGFIVAANCSMNKICYTMTSLTFFLGMWHILTVNMTFPVTILSTNIPLVTFFFCLFCIHCNWNLTLTPMQRKLQRKFPVLNHFQSSLEITFFCLIFKSHTFNIAFKTNTTHIFCPNAILIYCYTDMISYIISTKRLSRDIFLS